MTGGSEGWEATFHRANELWHSGRRDAAVAVLEAARADSATQSDTENEAFFASVLGSYQSLLGNTECALKEYQSAVDCEPGNPYWRLSLSEYLLSIGDAVRALHEVRASIDLIPTTERSTRHSARSLEGLCLLAQGQIGAAQAAFLLATEPHLVDGLRASSYDLRLVDGMCIRNLESSRCEQYLKVVIASAEAEARSEIREHASDLLRLLKSADQEQ
jgi:tetratricopeptide (TPR) repeat protein